MADPQQRDSQPGEERYIEIFRVVSLSGNKRRSSVGTNTNGCGMVTIAASNHETRTQRQTRRAPQKYFSGRTDACTHTHVMHNYMYRFEQKKVVDRG